MSDTPRTDAIGLQYDSDTFSRRTTDFARQLERELHASTVYVEQLAKMLRAAKCPSKYCEAGAVRVSSGDGDWLWEQCQWCDERRAALAKNPESPNPSGDTPYRGNSESGKGTGEPVEARHESLEIGDSLLAALKQIVAGDVGPDGTHHGTYSGSQCVEIAQAAIRKAGGKCR